MDLSRAKFVDIDGTRTRYFEAGTGPTVVLFHGGNFGSLDGADCAADWNLNFDGLAEHCHVVAIDKIGQGETDNPRTDADYTMQAVVAHALRCLEVLDLGECHIVGHSRGAYLTCRMTLDDPARIASNIMVDTGTLGPGESRTSLVFRDKPLPNLGRESQRWVMEHYSYHAACVTEDWLDEMVRIAALPKSIEAGRKINEGGLLHTLFLPHLGRQKAETFDLLLGRGTGRPNLLVWGANDPTATLDQGFCLFEMLTEKEKRTDMHIFNQAGHFTYREHPAAFNRLIVDFVNGV